MQRMKDKKNGKIVWITKWIDNENGIFADGFYETEELFEIGGFNKIKKNNWKKWHGRAENLIHLNQSSDMEKRNWYIKKNQK